MERIGAAVNRAIMGGVARSDAVVSWIFGQWCRHPLGAILVVIAGDIALITLYVLGPRELILAEDGAVEMTTALMFLVTFAVGLLAMSRPGHRNYPVLLPVAAILGLVGFLDEISFGARLFGWAMPDMLGGGNFDGAHDLVILTYRAALLVDPILIFALGGGAGVVAVLCAVAWRRELRGLLRRVLADRTYLAMALFIVALSFASLIDLEIGVLSRLGPLEEIAELNAALALLVAVAGASRQHSRCATTG